ncbi:hypothetical protein KP509_39G038400 [Ceratopteris richardii]|uniref:ABC transporter domain-containing protein n=1 Tax=Ceratopteris richardii TaxID=49495 RepID=A0A8T2Q0S5_CERRI|nr:hypothetical protein KP509_39G038400 [Ceratopteris richardii]KAH7277193.1 hypothetical protein KP509_39G038400 [Ceratopteris richardii]
MQSAPSLNEYSKNAAEAVAVELIQAQHPVNKPLQVQRQPNDSLEDEKMLGGLSPLSQTLWKSMKQQEPTPIVGDVSAWLTWRDLTVTVSNGGDTHKLLHSLTGYAEPGFMMAIMGPSGSGKSTLLDALAGRLAKNAAVSGEILVNGRRRKLSYGSVAYVTQEDTLIGTLTVRETIRYSAHLRLPDKMPREEKETIVESTILEMGLQDCADTPIGNWHLRGVSGGEKRRVSIALEILMRPRLLFLDEPTSGLDSAAAFFVTQTLRSLSRDGRTVLFSIHQPSSEVFALFDNLFLLSGGRAVYFGQAARAHEFYAQTGFPCPPRRNPSDHFLRCINADFDRVRQSLKGSSRLRENANADPLEKMPTSQVIDILISAYSTSEHAMLAQARVFEISERKGTILDSMGSQASYFMQSWVLTKRSFINMTRDIGYYWLRLFIYISVAICVGTIYFNVGTSYNAIMARGSCASFVSGFVTFMSIGGFPSFIEDMKVFQRERLNGHYGVLAFVIGNTLSSLPYLFIIAVAAGTICYYMAGLHPGFSHYAFFVVGLFGCVGVVESLMMAVASVVPNFLMGIITGAGILGIFMLVAGFFRLPNDLPKIVWRYPMSYISFNYWALQGQYKNDLLGLDFGSRDGLSPPLKGEQILRENFQIDLSWNKWWDCAMVFVNLVAYRCIFFINIKLSERFMPHVRAFYMRHISRVSKPKTQKHESHA